MLAAASGIFATLAVYRGGTAIAARDAVTA
jgi:hypothetical protein